MAPLVQHFDILISSFPFIHTAYTMDSYSGRKQGVDRAQKQVRIYLKFSREK